MWFDRRAGVLLSMASIALSLSMTQAADYKAQIAEQEGIEIVRLSDPTHHVEVSIVPSIGNIAYSMKVNGHEILYMPTRSLVELKAKPGLGGVPFLAPWANRIDGLSYWANGKKYLLNNDLGSLRLDGNGLPIHGLVSFSPLWRVAGTRADANSASCTSRLEFWKHPELMAQFPFAHTIEMTYKLHDGKLSVETLLKNLSADPMPVAVGFHPYFQLDDAPRDEWHAHLPVREHQVLNAKVTPTGEKRPMDLPDPYPLAGHQLDDGFTGLIRGADGNADFWVKGKNQQITVSYGPKYTVAVAYAPPGKSFICFEPMSAVTNGFNLAHDGLWNELQSVPPGGEWRGTFEIRPTGF
jgi:aldose 1-epimerase